VRVSDGRVFRTIEESALERFEVVSSSGILDRLAAAGRIVSTREVDSRDIPAGVLDDLPRTRRRVVEHERVPFISYPYEWPFALLKRAALFFLDLYLSLLESKFVLCDASAYNVQFLGTRPIFIDVLSIRPYEEGEYWLGYRQFCEHFLNPLLLTSFTGVPYQSWYRGGTEGIPVEDLARILPYHRRASWRVLLHVALHARMIARARDAGQAPDGEPGVRRRPMSKASLEWLVRGMRRWVAGLHRKVGGSTPWGRYDERTPYEEAEEEAKRAFVAGYVERRGPGELLDLGCNTGRYSELALATGAGRVIGIDTDEDALEMAVARADERRLEFLPIRMDVMNQSPRQGWAEREWQGLADRVRSDGVLALAFLHHLVIGRNVPLSRAVEWLVALAPSGVVEFVPKQDPMVLRMLRDREDIFPGYDVDAFRKEMLTRARIVREETISRQGRVLVEYSR
jgi:ribosomal protein L11 methylase PrmA